MSDRIPDARKSVETNPVPSLQLFVADETSALERRVALTPDAVQRLVKKYPSLQISVQANAGLSAGYPDAAYTASGAHILSSKQVENQRPDLILRITAPTTLCRFSDETTLVALNTASASTHSGNRISLEKLPRTSRAQALDVLSSQANLAGYAAVLLAARYFPRLFPLLMTAAGSSRPANVLVLGVGVAGLQAIATARRLGAQVYAYDIRPEVYEQILSLGAKPVLESPSAGKGIHPHGDQSKSGYATELTVAEQQQQQTKLATAIAAADVVITTAQVPAKPAPVLISATAVDTMKPGSVIVDMAAGGYNLAHGIAGGNCPLSRADEVIITRSNAVTLLAPTNLPSLVPGDASRFFAQNMVNLLALLLKKDDYGQLTIDFSDELIAAMHVSGAPQAAHAPVVAAIEPAIRSPRQTARKLVTPIKGTPRL